MTGPVSAALRFPANAAAAIEGGFTRVRASVASAESAYRLFQSMFETGDGGADPGAATPSRAQQSANQAAINNILKQQALAAAASAAMDINYGQTGELLEVRNRLLDGLDAQVKSVDGDEIYLALTDMRAAIVKDFNARAQGLPPLVQFTPGETLPALVLAQSLYGDANREAEIITRNNIRRPLFVPGGQPLEVSLA